MYERYFDEIERKVSELYKVAEKARSTGKDVTTEVEIKKANLPSERIAALFGYEEIGKRIDFWLSKGLDKYTLAFRVISEIVQSSLEGTGLIDVRDPEKVAELAVRVGLAIVTDAVVSAPVEGISKVAIKSTGYSRHLAVYYNGPIRTAGGTEGALSVVIADYVRQKMGIPRFKPSKKLVARYVEEVELYRRVAHLQYNSTVDEIRIAAENLPVEITGPPTEEVEVSSNRDLPDVETNRLRGGAILVLNDCIVQKAKKLLKLIKEISEKVGDFDVSSWEWLERLKKPEKKREGQVSGLEKAIVPNYKYMKDAVVGRPILSYPALPGGFRLRYGHARNTGLASVGVHPATMVLLDEFLAVGTQVRIERPGKSAVVMPVDSIEGPVVLLKDGSVVRVTSKEEAEKLRPEVKKILFLGDVLIGVGEFLENNHVLIPSPWVEEWWAALLKRKGFSVDDARNIPFDEALSLSLKYDVPMHPRWTYFWHDITVKELAVLIEGLRKSTFDGKTAEIPNMPALKLILEKLCVPHRVVEDKIVVLGDDAKALFSTLSKMDEFDKTKYSNTSIMKAVNDLAPFKVMPKATYYVGMRVGRPEKAKQRKMKPPINLLFPIGNLKGRSRSLSKASGKIKVEVALRRCPHCGKITPQYYCHECNVRTERILFCPICGAEVDKKCLRHPKERPVPYKEAFIDIDDLVREALSTVEGSIDNVKGVVGLTSGNKSPEPIEKGILRAKYDLSVFKDGTIRFDSTNAALTHFRPKEIGVSVEKLRELGYTTDINGEPLTRDDQLLELKIQDMILPRKAGEHLVRVAKFIDELLEKFYGLPKYYNVDDPEDLIGEIVFTISPHTFVANASRIIGFTNADVIFAHPFLHAAKRRNIDGDEDSIMLGLDALLNFSKEYLPFKPGGREDAPLLLTTRINLEYIDDETYNIETMWEYPLEFYEMTLKQANPSELLKRGVIQNVETRLSEEEIPSIPFTNEVSDICNGPLVTSYRKLDNMLDKLRSHIELEKKIRAVDLEDSLVRAISQHFIRDIAGNLRKFSAQKFRCVKCNKKYRRIPISGRCDKCGGELTLTVHKGTVLKYLKPTLDVLDEYEIGGYVRERVVLLEKEARTLFKMGGTAGLSDEEMVEGVDLPKDDLPKDERNDEEGLARFL